MKIGDYIFKKSNEKVLHEGWILHPGKQRKKSNGKEEKMITKDKNGNYKMNFSKLKPNIGDFIMTEIQISSSQYNKYKKGHKVQVFYLPENPQEAILKEDIK